MKNIVRCTYCNGILKQIDVIGIVDDVTLLDDVIKFARLDRDYTFPLFEVGDVIFTIGNWNYELRERKEWVVQECVIRSISISCNSKREWKRSYRAQRVVSGKIIDSGFNFREKDLGEDVFETAEEAQRVCDGLNKSTI